MSIAFGLCLGLGAIPSAGAAPITVGNPLDAPEFGSINCTSNGGCTFGLYSLDDGLPASPVDGVITSWSVAAASTTPGFAIRTLTRSGLSFTGVRTSAPVKPGGALFETFPTSLPIKAGQHLGLNVPFNGQIGLSGGGAYAALTPTLADGANQGSKEIEEEPAFSALVKPVPRISALSPPSGPPAGGTQLVITGTDFEGTTSVNFGSTAALAFSVNSETQITAFVPPGTGAVPVTVTTIAGTALSPQSFTYATSSTPAPRGPTPPPTCKVPKLKGKTLKSAKKRIRAADCRVGTLTKKEGATAKDGEVVKQVPKPGTAVPAATKVKVTLAP